MATRNKNDRPITIGDVNKFRKNWLNGTWPILMFFGPVMIAVGIFGLFVDPYVADNTIPVAIIGIIGGPLLLFLAFQTKNKAKKL